MMAVLLLFMLLPASFPERQAQATVSDDWPMYLYNMDHQGYNANFTAISEDNVASLSLVWTYTAGGNLSGNPVVVTINNATAPNCSGPAVPTIFMGAWDGNLSAINATTGARCWQTFLAQDNNPNPGSGCYANLGITSSATVATITLNGTPTQVVFVGASDILFAVNAVTGQIIWQNPLAGYNANVFSPAFIWSSPTYSPTNNLLYTSIASNCDETQPVDGVVYALDPATGTIKAQVSMIANNQPGGGVWGSPTVSPIKQTVYVATGNGFANSKQACNTAQPLTCAIVALDWTTLTVKHSWQVPASQFVSDGDFGSTPTLFLGSNGHAWLGLGNKNGWYYVLDTTTLSAGPQWEKQLANGGSNPLQGIIAPTAYYPGSVSNGQNKCTGVLYLMAGQTTLNGQNYNASVTALCSLTGQILWQYGLPGVVWTAAALANGLLVDAQGHMMEVREWTNGHLLVNYAVNQAIEGAPTFANGMIYVNSTDHNLYAFGPSGD